MTPTKTKAILRRLADDWRHEEAQLCKQFGDVVLPQSMRARKIKDTEAIYAAVEMIDRLKAAESEAIEQARLNGVGAERELALMAKLEAAEKSDAESIAMYRKARDERDALRTALEKIADWDSAWGPYPETNEAWRAMVIVTAREAVPRRGEKK